MANEIKIKNICPVIGMISSGKSSILNVLFNMDFLEASPDVTTKIVTIIRYNSNLKEPRFFQLKLQNEGNDDYRFYKSDKPTVVGKEQIKSKIKEINKTNRDDYKKNPEYENIFYMLEIGEVKYMEEEFLKNYDLADVPGVSEYIKPSDENKDDKAEQETGNSSNESDLTTEEMAKNIKIEKEINYLTQIFKILKNRMNNGIFIFSVDKFQLKENYLIIQKLSLVIQKPIENFLILLNKMDTSNNIENDIQLLNERFAKEFPAGTFNFTKNRVVQCSSFQIENELKMENEFAYLLYYNYINFIMNSKEFSNFRDYVIYFIKEHFNTNLVYNIDKREFKEKIESIKNDKSIKEIQNIIEKIKINHSKVNMPLLLDKENFEYNDEKFRKYLRNIVLEDNFINIPSQNNFVLIILYYLYLYKNTKIKLERSSETKSILEYFTIQNMNLKFNNKEIESRLQENENKDSFKKKVDEIIININTFFENYEKEGIDLDQKDNVKSSLKQIKNFLITSQLYYIPFLGLYNAGKSTILNNIIGYNLLPTKCNECTKKGVLIVNWEYDYPIIRKAKFIKEDSGDKNDISNLIMMFLL